LHKFLPVLFYGAGVGAARPPHKKHGEWLGTAAVREFLG